MIAPRILLFLTVAAAFPKDYLNRNRLSGVQIPSSVQSSGIFGHQRPGWSPPVYGSRFPYLQRYQSSRLGQGAIKAGNKNVMDQTFVVPTTLVLPPSMYGQLNSPKQQVIFLTGNNVLSLGGAGKSKGKGKGKSKDKRTQRGNVVQIFIARNNELFKQLKTEVPEEITKTVVIGGEAEIKKLDLGAEITGELFATKDVAKDTDLGLNDIVFVVDDKAELTSLFGEELVLGETGLFAADQLEQEQLAEAILNAAVQGQFADSLLESASDEQALVEADSLADTAALDLISGGQDQGLNEAFEDVEATVQGLAVEADLPFGSNLDVDLGIHGSATKEQALDDSIVLSREKVDDIAPESEVKGVSAGQLSIDANLEVAKGAEVEIDEPVSKEQIIDGSKDTPVAKVDEAVIDSKQFHAEGELGVEIEKSSKEQATENLSSAKAEEAADEPALAVPRPRLIP